MKGGLMENRRNFTLYYVLAVVALPLAVQATVARADPVINTHPRLLLTDAEKSHLLANRLVLADPACRETRALPESIHDRPNGGLGRISGRGHLQGASHPVGVHPG